MRRPSVTGSIYGTSSPRYLASINQDRRNNYRFIAQNLLLRVPRSLRFFPGEVQVFGAYFGLKRGRTSFTPGTDIEVTGQSLRLTIIRKLSFTPTSVEVSAENFSIYRTRTSLLFQQGNIEVSGASISLRPARRVTRFVAAEIPVSGGFIRLERVNTFTLPELVPTSRQFQPPGFAITNTRAENGLVNRRFMASKPAGATMRLSYDNVPDSVAQTFLDLYDQTRGGLDPVVLPPSTFASADTALRAFMLSPDPSLVWSFAEAPRVRFIIKGVVNVEIALVGRLMLFPNPLPIYSNTCPPPLWATSEPSGPYTCDVITLPDCALSNQTGCP